MNKPEPSKEPPKAKAYIDSIIEAAAHLRKADEAQKALDPQIERFVGEPLERLRAIDKELWEIWEES